MSPRVCCARPPQQHTELDKDRDLLPRNCGSSMALATRIIQGTNTALIEFPWMALLVYQTGR